MYYYSEVKMGMPSAYPRHLNTRGIDEKYDIKQLFNHLHYSIWTRRTHVGVQCNAMELRYGTISRCQADTIAKDWQGQQGAVMVLMGLLSSPFRRASSGLRSLPRVGVTPVGLQFQSLEMKMFSLALPERAQLSFRRLKLHF